MAVDAWLGSKVSSFLFRKGAIIVARAGPCCCESWCSPRGCVVEARCWGAGDASVPPCPCPWPWPCPEAAAMGDLIVLVDARCWSALLSQPSPSHTKITPRAGASPRRAPPWWQSQPPPLLLRWWASFLLAACWTPHVNSNSREGCRTCLDCDDRGRGSIDRSMDRWRRDFDQAVVSGVDRSTVQLVAYAKSNLNHWSVHRTYGSTSTAHTHTRIGVGRGKARRRGGIISSGRRRVFCLAACLVDRSVEVDA